MRERASTGCYIHQHAWTGEVSDSEHMAICNMTQEGMSKCHAILEWHAAMP